MVIMLKEYLNSIILNDPISTLGNNAITEIVRDLK